MEKDHDDNNNIKENSIQSAFRKSLNDMTPEQILIFKKKIMEIQQARKTKQNQGKKEEKKYEQQKIQRPQREKISQSFLVNDSCNKDNVLDQTQPESSQNHSQSQQSYYNIESSQSRQSDYVMYRNAQQGQSTLNHTPNTSNFSYKTKSKAVQNQYQTKKSQREQWENPDLESRSEPVFNIQQLKQLQAQFDLKFKQLGYQKSKQKLSRAKRSRQGMRSWPKLFKEDKKTFFFTMNLDAENQITLNKLFFQRLNKIDTFLLQKIDIGITIKFINLLKLLQKSYQSLRKLVIQRVWDQDDQDYKEHGFDFIKNLKNQRNLTNIEWRTNKLTNIFVDSFKNSEFFKLKELKIVLSDKIEDKKEQKALGKLIAELFHNIDHYDHEKDETRNPFTIILCSSVKKLEDLGMNVMSFKKRLIVRENKEKVEEVKESQPIQQQPPQPPQEPHPQQIPQPQSIPQQSVPLQPQQQQQQYSPQVLERAAQIYQQQQSQALSHANQPIQQLPPGGQNFFGNSVSSFLGGKIQGGVNIGSTTTTYKSN